MGTSVQLRMKLLKVALIASLGCEASNALGPDECKACSEECRGCQESCHRECEEDEKCMQTCMYANCRPELECYMNILSNAVRSFCQRDYNGDWKCAVNCPGQLQAFFGEHEVEALDCTNGKLVLGNFGFDKVIAQSMVEVDGPLECRKPDFDMDAIIDEVIKESPCRDQKFHRCQHNSHCVPTTSGPLYTCDCDNGFKLKGRVCVPIAEKVPVDDKEKCPDNFVETRVGDLGNRQLLVVRLLGRDDRGVGDERKVDARVRDQVGLELSKIDVEGTIEAERRGDGGDDLSDEPVEVGVGRALNVEVATADVVDGLIVHHEGTVGVLQGGVGGEDRVVRLDDGSGHLRGGVDGEFKLGLLAIVDRKAFHEKRGETRTRTTTEGVEEEKALETGALVGELAGPVKDEVNDFLADRVVATSVVVGGVFLARNQLLGVEELTVGSRADFIDDGGFQVDEDTTGDVLAGTRLGEEGVERVVTAANRLVRRHLTIGLDAVFEAVELPAGITNLDTGLADVDRDTLTHD